MTLIHGQASVTIVVVETVFSSLAIVAIGLRIWARRLMKRRLSLNDWAAVAALVTRSTRIPYLLMLTTASFSTCAWPVPSTMVSENVCRSSSERRSDIACPAVIEGMGQHVRDLEDPDVQAAQVLKARHPRGIPPSMQLR